MPDKNVGHDNSAPSSPLRVSGDPSVEEVSGETAGVRKKNGKPRVKVESRFKRTGKTERQKNGFLDSPEMTMVMCSVGDGPDPQTLLPHGKKGNEVGLFSN